MEQSVLVAFDDSKNAMRAVEYIAKSFTPENKVTLLSVIPDSTVLCKMNSPELIPYFKSKQTDFCTLEDKKRELVEAAMQEAKELLLQAGFAEENISLKIETAKKGIARDVIRESESGYKLLVIGRRGLSGIKEFFLGSVSHKIFSLAKDISVLIVN